MALPAAADLAAGRPKRVLPENGMEESGLFPYYPQRV
jgi:hypothetical protein